jgi:hypothetical protein
VSGTHQLAVLPGQPGSGLCLDVDHPGGTGPEVKWSVQIQLCRFKYFPSVRQEQAPAAPPSESRFSRPNMQCEKLFAFQELLLQANGHGVHQPTAHVHRRNQATAVGFVTQVVLGVEPDQNPAICRAAVYVAVGATSGWLGSVQALSDVAWDCVARERHLDPTLRSRHLVSSR